MNNKVKELNYNECRKFVKENLPKRNSKVEEFNILIDGYNDNIKLEHSMIELLKSKINSYVVKKLKYINVPISEMKNFVSCHKNSHCKKSKDYLNILNIYDYLKEQIFSVNAKDNTNSLRNLRNEIFMEFNSINRLDDEIFLLDSQLADKVNFLLNNDENFAKTVQFQSKKSVNKFKFENIENIISEIYSSYGIEKDDNFQEKFL